MAVQFYPDGHWEYDNINLLLYYSGEEIAEKLSEISYQGWEPVLQIRDALIVRRPTHPWRMASATFALDELPNVSLARPNDADPEEDPGLQS